MNISDIVTRRLLNDKPVSILRKQEIPEGMFVEVWKVKFYTTNEGILTMALLSENNTELHTSSLDVKRFFHVSPAEVVQIRFDRPMYFPVAT